MDDIERFAHQLRTAGRLQDEAQVALTRAEIESSRITAQVKVQAELTHGCKTNAAQERFTDEHAACRDARLQVGVAKGTVLAAKAELDASKMVFDTWRTQMATQRFEKTKIYNTD